MGTQIIRDVVLIGSGALVVFGALAVVLSVDRALRMLGFP